MQMVTKRTRERDGERESARESNSIKQIYFF
jgi:hypothetical protein